MLSNIKFVLVRPRNSGNVGAALRAIANFGFRDLAIVNMWNFDEEEASMMAASASPLIQDINFHNSLDSAIKDATVVIGTSARRRGKHRRIGVREFRNIIKKNREEKIAILFGSEKTGLTTEELDRCDYYLKIDTDSEFSSLNLAQSVVIVAYEIKQTLIEEAPIISPKKVTKNTILRIVDYAEKISDLTEAPETGKKNIVKTLWGITGRGETSEREGKILLWFFRHIWWYLENLRDKEIR